MFFHRGDLVSTGDKYLALRRKLNYVAALISNMSSRETSVHGHVIKKADPDHAHIVRNEVESNPL